MLINLRNLLENHLYCVEFIQVLCFPGADPVTYSYDDIFKNDIFMDYCLDNSKVNWSVFNDGLGSMVLRITPKRS